MGYSTQLICCGGGLIHRVPTARTLNDNILSEWGRESGTTQENLRFLGNSCPAEIQN